MSIVNEKPAGQSLDDKGELYKEITFYSELISSVQYKKTQNLYQNAQLRSLLILALLLSGIAGSFTSLYFLHEKGFFSEAINYRPYPDIDAAIKDLKPAMDQLLQIDVARELARKAADMSGDLFNYTSSILDGNTAEILQSDRRMLAALSRFDTYRNISYKTINGSSNFSIFNIDSYESTQNNSNTITRQTILRLTFYYGHINRYGVLSQTSSDMNFQLPPGLTKPEAWLKISAEERAEALSRIRDHAATQKKYAEQVMPLLNEGEISTRKQIDNMIGRSSVPSEVFVMALANKSVVSLSIFAIITTFVTLVLREIRNVNHRTSGMLSFLLAAAGAQKSDPNTLRALVRVVGGTEPDPKAAASWTPAQTVGDWVTGAIDRAASVVGKDAPKL